MYAAFNLPYQINTLISNMDISPNTYHWRVRIVDTYNNKSDWYNAFSESQADSETQPDIKVADI